jgi:type IV pilus assembly protein PilW
MSRLELNQSATPARQRRDRGVSIIELMVGIVVALLVSLAAAMSAQVFTASQRQGMSAGATSIGSASALSSIKEEISQAGLGFFADSQYLCNALSLSIGATIVSNNAAFVPLQITRAAGNDTISVVYGNRIVAGANARLGLSSTGGAAQLASLLPASQNDTVMLAPADAGVACTVRTVTNTPTAPTATLPEALTFANTGLYNQAALTIPTYAKDDRIALLGDLVWNTFSVNANRQLVMTRMISGDSAVLASNVLAFRAEYGVSATANALDYTLANWFSPDAAGWAALTPAQVMRVRAVRLGIVTRSVQKEKAQTPGNDATCTATRNDANLDSRPRLFGSTIDVAAMFPTDWGCYRYRVTTMVIPLRNFVMGRQS